MEGPGRVKQNLKPCRNCGRTFVPESLAKHESSCKNVQKKRKVFDPSKQRVTEDLSLRQIKTAQKKAVQQPKSHWRQKHDEFIRNIRAAKGAQGAIDRGEPLPPPPPPAENPDYVTCQYCSRRFNEKAAERHISFCKEQQKRVNAKRIPSQQEQARAASKGYQAPRPKGRGMSPSTADSSPVGGGYGASRGGYSTGPAPRGAPAARGPPSGARGTPPGPAGSKSDMSRTPGGISPASQGSGSSRGRAPAPGSVARGRATPASPGSYGDGMQKLLRGVTGGNHSMSRKSSSSSRKFRGSDSGYHSSNSESDAIPRHPISAVAKFCYECGMKYPSTMVKFCTECGLKRLEVR